MNDSDPQKEEMPSSQNQKLPVNDQLGSPTSKRAPKAPFVVSVCGVLICLCTIAKVESMENSPAARGDGGGFYQMGILIFGGAASLVGITVCIVGGALSVTAIIRATITQEPMHFSIAGILCSLAGPLSLILWYRLHL